MFYSSPEKQVLLNKAPQLHLWLTMLAITKGDTNLFLPSIVSNKQLTAEPLKEFLRNAAVG